MFKGMLLCEIALSELVFLKVLKSSADVLLSAVWYKMVYFTDIKIQHGYVGHKEEGPAVLGIADDAESPDTAEK